MATKKLTKSRTNKQLAGVIGGLGEYFGWSSDVITIIRIVYAVLALTSYGSLLLIYIIVAIIIPQAPRNDWRNKQDFSGFSKWPGEAPKAQKRKDVTPFDDDEDWSRF
ncbi:MAG: PspC domain-containing protein [Streptococcaceae bacterium]|nr:PspC domain-containing protein [Streptococcaceae bacterium]